METEAEKIRKLGIYTHRFFWSGLLVAVISALVAIIFQFVQTFIEHAGHDGGWAFVVACLFWLASFIGLVFIFIGLNFNRKLTLAKKSSQEFEEDADDWSVF